MSKPSKPAATGTTNNKTQSTPPVPPAPPESTPNPPVDNAPPVDNIPPVESTENNQSEEPIIKSGYRKIRLADLRGSYKDTHFDDNCEAEISDTTFDQLQKDFPNAEIEELS